MKKLSLKNLNLGASDLLQRNQLKTVFGGYDNFLCYGGGTTTFHWACADGSGSGSAYICRSHVSAYNDMVEAFCS